MLSRLEATGVARPRRPAVRPLYEMPTWAWFLLAASQQVCPAFFTAEVMKRSQVKGRPTPEGRKGIIQLKTWKELQRNRLAAVFWKLLDEGHDDLRRACGSVFSLDHDENAVIRAHPLLVMNPYRPGDTYRSASVYTLNQRDYFLDVVCPALGIETDVFRDEHLYKMAALFGWEPAGVVITYDDPDLVTTEAL